MSSGRLSTLREYYALSVKAGGPLAALAVALSLAVGLVEGVGLLFLIPLLRLAGVDLGGGATDAVAGRIGQALALLGLPLTLPVVLTLFVVVATVQALVVMAQSLANLKLEARLSSHLRQDLYDAILHTEWVVLSRQRGSDLVHAMTAEIDRTGAIAHQSLSTLTVIAQLAVALAVAARIAPLTTAVVAAVGAALSIAMRSRATHAERLGRDYAQQSTESYAVLSDGLSALRTIKTLGAEPHSGALVASSQDRLAATWHRLVGASVQAKFVVDACSAVMLAAIVYVALTALHVSAGALLVLLFILARAVPRAAALQHSVRLMLQALPAFERVTALMGRCRNARESTAAAPSLPLVRSVALDGVSFAYEPGRPALEGVSLEIPARRITALVGMSGAGKTTVADIVLGLLTPDTGTVLVDGVELTADARRTWRARVAYVSQEPFFFHDTIAANLRWARPDATDADLAGALVMAGASEFVSRLPEGLATVVGDRGARLSGGERQRLAIARALLRDPDVLVLDEPTSALDAVHEQHVLATVHQLAQRVTVLLITHRLSSVRTADRIYVLDRGRIIEEGSWLELSNDEGVFGRLSRLQGVVP